MQGTDLKRGGRPILKDRLRIEGVRQHERVVRRRKADGCNYGGQWCPIKPVSSKILFRF